MTEREVFIRLAQKMADVVKLPFDRVCVDIERGIYSVDFCSWLYYNNEKQNVDIDFDIEDAKVILELYTITQTQPPIHKDWNRAVFTLYPDGKVNMEYIFDAKLQAELDKYNAKARAVIKAAETRLAKKTFFERGYGIRLISPQFSRFVVIKGVEFTPFYLSDVVVFCTNMMKHFDLFRESDQKEFFNQVKINPFVDGILSGSGHLMYELSYDEYLREIEKAKYYAVLNKKNLDEFIYPFHKVRKSEVESFYQFTLSIVIKGVEISKFDDAEVGYYGYQDKYPGYIDVSASEREQEIVSLLPQEELKKISVGNPRDGFTYPTLIPNKFIEKIILRRKYLNIDLVENGEDKQEFTGKEDVFEIDPVHPDKEVLELMEKYKMIYKKKKYKK